MNKIKLRDLLTQLEVAVNKKDQKSVDFVMTQIHDLIKKMMSE